MKKMSTMNTIKTTQKMFMKSTFIMISTLIRKKCMVY